MPWTCPACQNAIRYSEAETAPRLGVTYRCPICRLELVVDHVAGKMTLAPFPTSDESQVRKTSTAAVRASAADRRRR